MRPRVFVGDVQGCAAELDELLAAAADRVGADFELWCVGDLVNRGPASLRVLERVRELDARGRAKVVLGNHDLALLEVAWELRPLRELDTFRDVLSCADAEDWVEWLRRRPLALTAELRGEGLVMVHAAVHPAWTRAEIESRSAAIAARLGGPEGEAARELLAADPARDPVRDDLARLTSCRSAFADGTWSSLSPEAPADAWHARWSRYGHDFGVVYGHWALQGLHVARNLRGLDTGCVHHERNHVGWLTAWLPDDPGGGFEVPDDRFLKVRAHRRYYWAAGER